MLQRFLIAAIVILGILLAVDISRRSPSTASAIPAVPVDTGSVPATPAAAIRATHGLVPGVDVPAGSTPTIDLMARLAVRRRIEREGQRIYLDSMLSRTDSIVSRWGDRTDRVIHVVFLADTTLSDWRAALDDARAGLNGWSGSGAGVELRETFDTAHADVRVTWVRALPGDMQVGNTSINWGSDGVITSALMSLALVQNTDSTPLPAIVRRRVALHEFGHALGLPHSSSRNDAMYPTSPMSSPSSRDLATLMLLYALPPGPVRVQ